MMPEIAIDPAFVYESEIYMFLYEKNSIDATSGALFPH